ncbi:MAG: PQQ-dependent sugar dehydrogenase [Flavobacteriales bacterium]|nr:PQQ-dependent sugar dehydrogenase [Flavobacteriales bacterium]MBK6891800.1 PQQ-dependent sugar dehydrogenase [Flavobacteriales bacterium]MBK7247719.1 PQQ-dependent sugar dehydrogenase [Flavobacteriales bacterium]MBK9060449.1 PQQ-dependent sugar dehydrogenase [Flavobacteriales bacterium]MBK9597084.1 PQQ-dependent sugar dehydrogenase [Flavobacteriales bacterium]
MKRTLLALTLTLPMLLSAQLNPVRIALHNWATGLNRPVWLANAGDDRLFVVQQGGIIKIITDSMQVMSTPFLNITSAVNSNGNEQGLLGLAFDPEYATNGYFYVYYIFGSGNGTSRISRFHVSTDPNVADATSETVLYTLAQPFTNHNGGCLQFGPDGYLYCGFGDGGSGDDPQGNGQNFSTALASMIRIDVSQHDSTYAVPPDNPWVSTQDTLPELWAKGLRNPWRYGFDRLTGDMWIGDVGQNAWEEVDFWPAGDNSGPNFGWRCREGLVPTPGVSQSGCAAAAPFVEPVAVFNHTTEGWCSVIGGYVYRGPSFPHLYGKYIFTDYCNGDFLTFGENYDLDTLLLTSNFGYAAFGEDSAGEMYVADVENNNVKKIVDPCPMPDPVISFDGETLTSTAAIGWQWVLNGFAVSGATGQSYVPQANGAYQVRANFGGACLLMSDTIQVIISGVHETGGLIPAVYPQPASSSFQLRSDDRSKPTFTVDMMDAVGNKVGTFTWPGTEPTLTINVADLAEGSYVLRGNDGGAQKWARMVMVAH